MFWRTKAVNSEAGLVRAKPEFMWNRLNTILLAFSLLYTAFYVLPSGAYVYGRFFPNGLLYIGMAIFPIVTLLMLVKVIVYGTLLTTRFRKYCAKKRAIIAVQNAIVMYCLISFVLTPLRLPGVWSHPCKPFLYGFRLRIKAIADIPEIQSLLKEIDPNSLGAQTAYFPQSDPNLIAAGSFLSAAQIEELKACWRSHLFRRDFRRTDAVLTLDKNKNPRVSYTWGGTFIHWGAVIGTTEMSIPRTIDLEKEYLTRTSGKDALDYPDKYCLPVSSGVYVWYELQP